MYTLRLVMQLLKTECLLSCINSPVGNSIICIELIISQTIILFLQYYDILIEHLPTVMQTTIMIIIIAFRWRSKVIYYDYVNKRLELSSSSKHGKYCILSSRQFNNNNIILFDLNETHNLHSNSICESL